ncbi:hypothetical protein EV401DRAFT_2057766 [Pisolithus croceorrhizus]|nr:hypothetical protein EV401DRAFT_2057766 [Pisolithus croceorrhizus]
MADVGTTQAPLNDSVDPTFDDAEEADSKEIQLMKLRVEEMEREAKKLRELQAAAESASSGAGGSDQGVPMETEEDRAMADSRSIFVGNVDYGATPEEIQGHFQACGTINRVTILCDKFTGHPKGYAYVEFAEPDFIDAALAMDNSLFRGRSLLTAFLSTCPDSSRPETIEYPFSKNALLPVPLAVPPDRADALRKGRGLMYFLQQNLPEPKKRQWLQTLFSRQHPQRLLPGSVLTVTLEHAPGIFSGVLLSVRRRGPDTSFVVRNVVQRTGVEMQFFVNSPHLKDIRIIQRAGGEPGKEGRRQRRAKLFFLRDSPSKMSAISAGLKG